MSRIANLNKLQDLAVQLVGEQGTLQIATGVGKSFISLKWLLKYVPVNSTVIFWGETTTREQTLYEEIAKFKSLYNKDISKLYQVEFRCYQSAYKEATAHIYDEVDFAISPEYSKCLEGTEKYKLGITATIPNTLFNPLDEFSILTKPQYIESKLPVKYTYTRNEGIADGILSPFELHVVEYMLDNNTKYLNGGTKAKEVMVTEYSYNDKFNKGRMNFAMPVYYKKFCGMKLTALFNNPIESIKESAIRLISKLEGKTIVFATSIDLLEVVLKENIVSNRNTASVNKTIIDNFNKGIIKNIGSFKMLQRGITLEGVENIVILSYYSKEHLFDQMLGRVIRFVENKTAKCYIYKCPNTLQEKWFDTMIDKNIETKSIIYYKNT